MYAYLQRLPNGLRLRAGGLTASESRPHETESVNAPASGSLSARNGDEIPCCHLHFLLVCVIFAPEFLKGCLTLQAEIIPIEPDTGNAETGRSIINTHTPFQFFHFNKKYEYEKVFSALGGHLLLFGRKRTSRGFAIR